MGFVCAKPATAYEWKAHMKLSRISAQRSILSNDKFMDDIGLERLSFKQYEMDKKQCDSLTYRNNYLDFIYCGSMQEDSSPRPLAHFYDPINDIALDPNRDGVPLTSTHPTPNWALEDREPATLTVQIIEELEIEVLEQENSLKDAYSYYKRSLTERRKINREENKYTFFKTLGMVVHLLHDMAQPEHVRNDQHFPYLEIFKSKYEQYLEDEINRLDLSQYNYARIDYEWFWKARTLWEDDLFDKIGLSEFTNKNFVSNDTNFLITPSGEFSTRQYSEPLPIESNMTEVMNFGIKDQASDIFNDPSLHGEVWFVSTEVQDEYLKLINPGGSDNISINNRASALNVFANDLLDIKKIMHCPIAFSVNEATFESAVEYLLPRAISYGTGLIDYFFRGHIDVEDVSVSKELGSVIQVSLTVKNTTSRDNPDGEAFVFDEGRFSLYYDIGSDGVRGNAQIDSNYYSADLTTAMDDQDTRKLVFTIPVTAQWNRSKPLTLVFDGIIGYERGIATKVFYPDPLLAININGYEGESSVENRINIYKSYDLGYSWDYSSIIAIPVTDSTLTTDNRLIVQNAINLGEGELLLVISYLDYLDENGQLSMGDSTAQTIRSEDYGQTWEAVSFDWSPLFAGSGNVFDASAIFRSAVYTGDTGLAALRVQQPDSEMDPTVTIRKFELFTSSDLGLPGSWYGAGGLGTGGEPEIDYLGADSYIFTGLLSDSEGAEKYTTDSIISRTDDGGYSFYPLTEINPLCSDTSTRACEQHMINMGDNRILGWLRTNHNNIQDYLNNDSLYISEDGGLSWQYYSTVPFSSTCFEFNAREGMIEDIIFIGKTPNDKEVLLARTECREVTEDQNGSVQLGAITGAGLFVSSDSGAHWRVVNLPPTYNHEDVFLYLGDNGAIPGLYRPEN
jgi:hypothetical protein